MFTKIEYKAKVEKPNHIHAKICGIADLKAADLAIRAGADALGFYCWDDLQLGKNTCTKETAKKINQLALLNSINTFYLTYATTANEIIADHFKIGFSHVQLLGDIPVTEIEKIKKVRPNLITVKVIGVIGEESVKEAKDYGYNPYVDQLLLDSRSKETGKKEARGGTGKIHDWNISNKIVSLFPDKQTWLAGGIRPENVQNAIRTVKPDGIDVETGVQKSDGSKDPEKIRAMVFIVHSEPAKIKSASIRPKL